MCFVAPGHPSAHNALTFVMATIALIVSISGAHAQTQSVPFLRCKYFHDQRAFPFDEIPSQALQDARTEYEMKWRHLLSDAAPAIPGNTWSAIGPTQTTGSGILTPVGRITTIAIHPVDSNTIYIGGAQGGVWKTTNGGNSWTPLTDAQCSLAMGSVAIDPVNPNIVYAGTGEENFSADSYYGCGVLKSIDGGLTWTQTGASVFLSSLSGGARIGRVLINPATAGSTTTTTLLAATTFGLYRSTDSGATWNQVLGGTATDVLIDPGNTSIVYAALGATNGS